MPPDNQEILNSLDAKQKNAQNFSLIGYLIAMGGGLIAIGTEMHQASKQIGAGWFKEYRKSIFKWDIQWKNAARNKIAWMVGAGVGLGGLIIGLLEEKKAETIADVRNAMTPRDNETQGLDNQWRVKLASEQSSEKLISK